MDERLITISKPDMMTSSNILENSIWLYMESRKLEKKILNVANVVTLGKRLQVNLTPGDIDIVHRMNTKSKDKPRPIIARFSNYNAKNKLYKARLNLRNADLKDVGAEKIFINENLAACRAELFKEARKVKRKI